MKPVYRPLEDITYDEALRILEAGTIEERILLPLRAGETMVDWKQAQTICIRSFDSDDPRVRANAALGLAYIARTKVQLEKHLVKPLLVKELRENIENRWRIIDAITDINYYLGWHLEEKALEKIKAEQGGSHMDSQKISECMKRNMEKNNITAEILSEKTGLSLSRIEEYISGEFVPKAFELKLIANEVGVPLISLIHGGGWIEYYMKDENGKTICKWEEY